MRIVTRADFDGVVCAVLLREALEAAAPVLWVEPNEVQRGQVAVGGDDVLANLPFVPGCAMWFDHHYTNRHEEPFEGVYRIAPSAAGLIHEYFRGRFRRDYRELVQAADKIDAADLTEDEVLHPEKYDYVLLSMTISDGHRRDEDYCNHLVALLGSRPIGQVMGDRLVQEKCRWARRMNAAYARYLQAYTRVVRHVSITDFRPLPQAPAGNRFLVYSLFPQTSVNVRIAYEGPGRQVVVVNVGHSIFNRSCRVNAGLLLSAFEGGGHRAAASCRFDARKAEDYVPKIIEALVQNEDNERRASE